MLTSLNVFLFFKYYIYNNNIITNYVSKAACKWGLNINKVSMETHPTRKLTWVQTGSDQLNRFRTHRAWMSQTT